MLFTVAIAHTLGTSPAPCPT